MQVQTKFYANIMTRMDMEINPNIIRKAIEIQSLVMTKAPTIFYKTNENCKALLCLDIACEAYNVEFDTSRAVIVAVSRKNAYTCKRKTIVKILNLSKELSIRDVILKLEIFSLNPLEKTANEIHKKFLELNGEEENQTSTAAMCVYFGGKIEKIKLDQKKLQIISGLSAAQWRVMMKSWAPWAMNVVIKKKKGNYKTMLKNALEREISVEAHPENSKEVDENVLEPYDEWAKRIIKKARLDSKKRKFNEIIVIS